MAGIKPGKVVTASPEETIKAGQKIGSQLSEGSILCFFGDLGAGKTTLIKGIVKAITDFDPDVVNSPTFVYLNIYEGMQTVYHFDLYRLQNAKEFIAMGFDEYLGSPGVCCLEWSERIEELLPLHAIRIEMKHLDQQRREIQIK